MYIQGQYFYLTRIKKDNNISDSASFETELRDQLFQFKPVHLSGLEGAKLMDRVDTKFVFRKDDLPEMLSRLKDDYEILEIEGKRKMKYESLYFDGPGLPFYLAHHNQRDHRFKVRFRKYSDSDSTFLEVKEKRKGRTKKTRIQVADFEEELSQDSLQFVEQFVPGITIKPMLRNAYSRITLVKQSTMERATIDLGLTYEWGDQSEKFSNLAIAELKQERIDRKSAFYQLMKSKMIRPYQVSKYCIGMITTRGMEHIKYNRFKKKIRTINTIENDS